MELLVETGESLVSGMFIILYNTISNVRKDNKKDKANSKLLNKQLKENKITLENNILSYVESNLKNLSHDFDQILSNYNSENLISILKLLYKKFKKDSEIKTKIEEKINNFKHSKYLNHYNILVLGQNKRALINSIKINEDINIENHKEFTSYAKENIRLLDYQEKDETDNKKKDIKSAIKLIKESLMKNESNKFIHCIWYCISGKKVDKSEKQNIVKLINLDEEYSIPLIILHTGINNGEENKEDIGREIKKIIKENKQKDDNICQIIVENKNSIIEDEEDYIFEKGEIQNIISSSLKKIKLALNSSCFLKMKLKAEYENEINQKNSELKTIINDRINEFLIGNDISNIYLLNKQIINIIINKLLNYQKLELDKKMKDSIIKSFKDFEQFIRKKFKEYYDKNIDNPDELMSKFKSQMNKEKNEKTNNIIYESINFYIDELFSKKKEELIIYKDGVQDKLTDRIFTLYKDVVFKKCSSFIDNKIREELNKLLFQSFNMEINNYDQIIYKKIKYND